MVQGAAKFFYCSPPIFWDAHDTAASLGLNKFWNLLRDANYWNQENLTGSQIAILRAVR